jgi:hypothetical protein
MMLFINARTTRGAATPLLLTLWNNSDAPALLQVPRSHPESLSLNGCENAIADNRLSGWQGLNVSTVR